MNAYHISLSLHLPIHLVTKTTGQVLIKFGIGEVHIMVLHILTKTYQQIK